MERHIRKNINFPTIGEIREKGNELGFSYVQSLSLFLYETILYWVSKSDLREELWLKPSDLQIIERHSGVCNEIIFYRENVSYQELHESLIKLFQGRETQQFKLEWDALLYDKKIEIVLDTKLEQVAIPFKMIICPILEKDRFPKEENYEFLLLEEKQITYNAYPMEQQLTECFYEILDKLELINDGKVYDTVYWILKNYPVEGRRMYLHFTDYLRKNELASAEQRWDTVLGYIDYTYMKKKWDKYRRIYEKEISWEECIKLMNEFFSPIWRAYLEDHIFLGDWMPSLGRYLD